MSSANYISTIDRYHEHAKAVRELIESIVTGIGEPRLLEDPNALRRVTERLAAMYPFVDLIYALDADGIQIAEYGTDETGFVSAEPGQGKGMDRSQRPYFKQAQDCEGVYLTGPYLSSASRDLCISATLRMPYKDGVGFLVVDVDIEAMMSFLLGDTLRRKAEPVFRLLYSTFALAMLLVAGVLFYSSMSELITSMMEPGWVSEVRLKPFEVIVILTLAMAIFDLAKTIFEEEVLMQKDVHRHSTVRRTMTRFVAAILVAILIEGLLTMFKVSMGYSDQGLNASLMVFSAAALLIALGLYVYLGAMAERALLGNNKRSQRTHEPDK